MILTSVLMTSSCRLQRYWNWDSRGCWAYSMWAKNMSVQAFWAWEKLKVVLHSFSPKLLT